MNTNQELVLEIYKCRQKTILNMSLEERCDLQKLLQKAIQRDADNPFLDEVDRDSFKYLARQFEADIFLIDGKQRERILTQVATIQIALGRISEILG